MSLGSTWPCHLPFPFEAGRGRIWQDAERTVQGVLAESPEPPAQGAWGQHPAAERDLSSSGPRAPVHPPGPRGRTLTAPLRPQDCPRVFSAGLDLTEICGRNPAHYAKYWKALQELWLRTYLSSLVLVAAINVRVPPRGPPGLLTVGQPWGGWTQPSLSPQKGRGQSGRPTEVSLPLQTR